MGRGAFDEGIRERNEGSKPLSSHSQSREPIIIKSKSALETIYSLSHDHAQKNCKHELPVTSKCGCFLSRGFNRQQISRGRRGIILSLFRQIYWISRINSYEPTSDVPKILNRQSNKAGYLVGDTALVESRHFRASGLRYN